MDNKEESQEELKLFNNIKRQIKRKLNNPNNDYFGDTFKKEYIEVKELIRRSIETGESNSAILCGPPGSGKTVLIKSVIQNLQNDGVIHDENCVIVWLNGLLHTDDRLALQDIARQLKMGAFTDQELSSKSFQESLAHLMEQLQRTHTLKPTVLFLLDEFHLFTEHKNQLLLYNLFDTTQSAKSPISVLGITCYSDVMDLLEKRVLSRFSHRLIHMAKTVSVDDRLKFLKHVLTLDLDSIDGINEIYAFVWDSRTEELLQSPAVRHALEHSLESDPGETRFRNLLFQLFNTITFKEPLLSINNLVSIFSPEDEYIRIISKLSALEVSLIVAIKHYTVNYEREPFNFEMILTQYLKFVKQHASTMVSERAVILKAFQRLQELELIVAVKKGAANVLGKIPIEYQLYTFNLTEEQVAEGVKLNKGISADLLLWAQHMSTT